MGTPPPEKLRANRAYGDIPADEGLLQAWARKLGLQQYWDRQNQLAREGLDMAEQGAQGLRRGDPMGAVQMTLGPLGYLTSPINALVPTDAEIYSQLPKEIAPAAAGLVGAAAMGLPGPKTRNLSSFVSRLKAAQGNLAATSEIVREMHALGANEVKSIAKELGIRSSAGKAGHLTMIEGQSAQVVRDRDIAERIRRGQ